MKFSMVAAFAAPAWALASPLVCALVCPLVCLLPVPVWAQPASGPAPASASSPQSNPPSTPQPTPPSSLNLMIDPLHTRVSFEMGALGVAVQRGSFTRTTGRISIDRVARTGTIDVTIDAASLGSGSAAREAQLKGEAWLDVARFPAISFRSTRVAFDADRVVGVDGDLTLHGVTRPVTLAVSASDCIEVHPLTRKPACGAEASVSLRRSDFGLAADAASFADAVGVRVTIEALQQ